MFVHFINNRLYHIHSSNDHDDFVALVKASRGAFFMNQNGQIQFNEVRHSNISNNFQHLFLFQDSTND